MDIDIFFDYTCRHSFALHRLIEVDPPKVAIRWRTFSLKELRRSEAEPSLLLEPEKSFSVLALALAHAVEDVNFLDFHRLVFERVHASAHKLGSDDLFDLADAAGVTRKRFEDDRELLIQRLAEDQDEAMQRWNAHGTPTIVFDRATSVYFRFELEERGGSATWHLLEQIARSPWLLEAKRSR